MRASWTAARTQNMSHSRLSVDCIPKDNSAASGNKQVSKRDTESTEQKEEAYTCHCQISFINLITHYTQRKVPVNTLFIMSSSVYADIIILPSESIL